MHSLLELGLTIDSQEFLAVAKRNDREFVVAVSMPAAWVRLALQALIRELAINTHPDHVRRWVASALDRALPPGEDAPWQ